MKNAVPITFLILSLISSAPADQKTRRERFEERATQSFSDKMKEFINSPTFRENLIEAKKKSGLEGVELEFFVAGFIGECMRLTSYQEYETDDRISFARVTIFERQPIYSFIKGRIEGNRYSVTFGEEIFRQVRDEVFETVINE